MDSIVSDIRFIDLHQHVRVLNSSLTSFWPAKNALILSQLPLSPNQRSIFTYDEIGRLLASDSPMLLLRLAAVCWASHQQSCHMVISQHYRCH